VPQSQLSSYPNLFDHRWSRSITAFWLGGSGQHAKSSAQTCRMCVVVYSSLGRTHRDQRRRFIAEPTRRFGPTTYVGLSFRWSPSLIVFNFAPAKGLINVPPDVFAFLLASPTVKLILSAAYPVYLRCDVFPIRWTSSAVVRRKDSCCRNRNRNGVRHVQPVFTTISPDSFPAAH